MGLGPCRRLRAWSVDAPWPGIDSGGHGRIVLEFDDTLFQIEISRIARFERPRFWVAGTRGSFVKEGLDPQENALRSGDIDTADEPPNQVGRLRVDAESEPGRVIETRDPHRPWTLGFILCEYRRRSGRKGAAGCYGRAGPRGGPHPGGRPRLDRRATDDRGSVGISLTWPRLGGIPDPITHEPPIATASDCRAVDHPVALFPDPKDMKGGGLGRDSSLAGDGRNGSDRSGLCEGRRVEKGVDFSPAVPSILVDD